MYGQYFSALITIKINGILIDVDPFSDTARHTLYTYRAPRQTKH